MLAEECLFYSRFDPSVYDSPGSIKPAETQKKQEKKGRERKHCDGSRKNTAKAGERDTERQRESVAVLKSLGFFSIIFPGLYYCML